MQTLVCTLMRLLVSSGDRGAGALALMPAAWKMLASYMLVSGAPSSSALDAAKACRVQGVGEPRSPASLAVVCPAACSLADPCLILPPACCWPQEGAPPEGTGLSGKVPQLSHLAPSTLLAMLQACSVGSSSGSGSGAGGGSGSGGSGGAAEVEVPQPKRRRRSSSSSRQGGEAAAGDAEVAADAASAQQLNTAAAGSAASGRGTLRVGDAAVDTGAVQSAVQRVLQWLTTTTHDNWRGSNYVQWRSGAVAQLPAQQQQQQVAPVQLPAALAAAMQQQQQQQQQEQEQEAAVAAAMQQQQEAIVAQAAQLQAHIQAAMAAPEGLPVAMQEAAAAANVAAMAAVAAAAPAAPPAQPQQQQQQQQAGAALPRQAFVQRQLVAPTVAAAFDDHW